MDYAPLPNPVRNSNRPHPHPYVQDPVLYISNLPPHVTDDHLATTFRYCTPFKLNILRDATNRPRPEQTLSGTIQFEFIYAAEKALATLQSRPIQGLHPHAPLILAPYPPTACPTFVPSPTALPRFVRYLPFDFTESKLYDLFRLYGALASVRMHVGLGDSTSGVVEFWNAEDALFADNAMHLSQVEDGLIVMSKYDQGFGEDTSDHDEPSPHTVAPVPSYHVHDRLYDPCNLFCKNLDFNIDESRLKPRQPKDAMKMEGNALERDNAKRLMGVLNWKLESEARLVNKRAKQSVESQMGVPISDIFSRSPFDLTGQVTRPRVAEKNEGISHLQKFRFRREITVWWGLKHPNILPFLGTIVDSSTNPDIPAMVCPFAENGALTTYLCERDNELTIAKRLTLINDVAHGLQYLHSQQIVHGDLSGSNVLIDGERNACIADFGLSTLLTRLDGSTFATTRQAKGTMRWMAPEVLDPDDSHDPKTAPTMERRILLEALCCRYILTGKVPYHHLARDEQVVFAIAKGTKHARPDTDAVTDYRWKFMERCWSPAKASKSRPSSDEISEFSRTELAKAMTTGQKVKLATSASTSSTTASRLKLPAAESGLARSLTTGMTPPEDDVEAAGGLVHEVGDRSRLIQEQQVARPPFRTIASLARLPAAKIIEIVNSTSLVDRLLLPKPGPSVVKATDEFINGLLDKPQKVQKQIVRDKLFRTIKSYGIKDPPKVTIALLDQEDLRALARLMHSYPSILKEKALIMKASLGSW